MMVLCTYTYEPNTAQRPHISLVLSHVRTPTRTCGSTGINSHARAPFDSFSARTRAHRRRRSPLRPASGHFGAAAHWRGSASFCFSNFRRLIFSPRARVLPRGLPAAPRANADELRPAPAVPAAAAGAKRSAWTSSLVGTRRFTVFRVYRPPPSLYCGKALAFSPTAVVLRRGPGWSPAAVSALDAPFGVALVWLGAVVLVTAMPPCRAPRRQVVVVAATPHGCAATLWSCSRQLGALLLLHFLSTSHSSLGCSL